MGATPKQKGAVHAILLVVGLCLAASPIIQAGNFISFVAIKQKKAKPIEVSSDHPLWRVDLHSMGYPAGSSQLQGRESRLYNFDTVDFVSEGVVAATFITQEPIPGLQRRDDPNRAPPYRLHAVFMNSTSGKVLKMIDWPLDNANAGIFPRFDGSFLFLSTQRIVLYSADWTPVRELPLPQLQLPLSFLDGISESPTGKVLLLRIRRERSGLCLRILTDTLEGSEEPCGIRGEFTISDKAIAANGPIPGLIVNRGEVMQVGPVIQFGVPVPEVQRNMPMSGINSGIMIRELGKPMHPLCDCGTQTPQFVNDDMVVVYGMSTLSLFGVTGEIKFKEVFEPRGDWIDLKGRPLRASADGRRFAVAINDPVVLGPTTTSLYFSTGDMPAEFPNNVKVFDLPTGRWICELKNNKKQFPQIWGLALSPNGEKLTIDSGGVIQAYVLPQVQ
jgi:hypothetical protein